MSKRNREISDFLVQDYMENVLENFEDGIYITDSEATTIYLNHSYERISGLAKEEMLGKNMKELVEKGVISMSGTLSVLENKESLTSEQRFKTGKRAVITSTPVFEDPEKKERIIMVVTVVREVTEIYLVRKELQRQKMWNRQYLNEIERLKKELSGGVDFVAEDASSLRLMETAERVALSDGQVFISGEAGTGKGKLASFIHRHSRRADFPFLRIDFQVLPQESVENYLFGYTDAEKNEYQTGLLESADGGTVYINEIRDIPQKLKGNFLALFRNEKCFFGDGNMRNLNIRFICGSTKSFRELEESGEAEKEILDCFRMFPMEIAPLKERKNDIVPLMEFFLRKYNRQTGEKKRFSRNCFRIFREYDWPGNVGELAVLVNRAAIMSGGEAVEAEDVLPEASQELPDSRQSEKEDFKAVNLKEEVARIEASYMTEAFLKYQNIREAAENLGMDSSTFVRKRQKYEKAGYMKSDIRK
ncbi:MAG: sigma 54-interacting transcriptional regulator [Eubacterium sp.]|nr:sigma 54-interacting transcriptional regulator [Eubacterium sp.]